jgi:hypothetical protein
VHEVNWTLPLPPVPQTQCLLVEHSVVRLLAKTTNARALLVRGWRNIPKDKFAEFGSEASS